MFLSVKYLWRQCVPLSIYLLPSLPHELPELLVAGGGDVDGVVVDLPGLQDVQYCLLTGLHLDPGVSGLICCEECLTSLEKAESPFLSFVVYTLLFPSRVR